MQSFSPVAVFIIFCPPLSEGFILSESIVLFNLNTFVSDYAQRNFLELSVNGTVMVGMFLA
jgi:hypothetical protein